MRRSVLLLVGVVALLAVVPAASGQSDGGSDEVVFYGHPFLFGAGFPMPANTAYPVGEANLGLGPGYTCTNYFDDGADTVAGEGLDPSSSCKQGEENRLYLYSTAGPVDVASVAEFFNEGAYSQLHNERGQAKPILLDTDGSISTRLYMSVDFHSWFVGGGDTYCFHPRPEEAPCAYPYWGWDPGAREDFVVNVTFYSAQLGEYKGEAASQPPVHEAVTNGNAQVVAEGQFGPERVMSGLPGSEKVFEVKVDLGQPQVESIPKTHDFFMTYQFYNKRSGQTYSTGDWRIWSGEFFPPRFTLPVENDFAVESVIPQFVHGKLVILGVLSSPWGSYDVSAEATELAIREKGTGDVVTPDSLETFSDFSVAHGGHFDPANVTYIWDYRKDGLEPGEYEITVSGETNQGSSASCTANFTIQAGGQPGPVDVGTCGFQTLTEEQREELREEAGEQADEGERMRKPDPLPGARGAGLAGLLVVGLVGPAVRRRP
jgi:hypothetical protein